jgi:hypothetical protein
MPSNCGPALRLGLVPAAIQALLDKWLAILPNPFTDQDSDAGYRYQLSILQAEFSLTQMLDAPVTGRIFFEEVIRENLDNVRPDRVSLVFDRRLMKKGARQTPGRFRTRVITDGVTPSLHVDYKHATIKQYHKLRHEVARCERTRRQEGRLMVDVGGVVPGQCSMARARPDVRRR